MHRLIALGKTKKAIGELLRITAESQLTDLYEETLLQSARYETYSKDKRLGTSDSESQEIVIARINEALLQIIDQLPSTTDRLFSGGSMKNKFRPLSRLILVIFMAGILLFNFNSRFSINSKSSSESLGSNSVTVFVHGKQGRNDLILQNKGKVEITYGGARVLQGVNEKGQAFFNEIPERFFSDNAKVYINIRDTDGEPYRAQRPDSLYNLDPQEPIFFPVILENLDRVFGSVYWNESPLEGVIVSIDNVIRDTTDNFGEYKLQIPEEMQKKIHQVKFLKPGFKMQVKSAYPQTNRALNIVMNK